MYGIFECQEFSQPLRVCRRRRCTCEEHAVMSNTAKQTPQTCSYLANIWGKKHCFLLSSSLVSNESAIYSLWSISLYSLWSISLFSYFTIFFHILNWGWIYFYRNSYVHIVDTRELTSQNQQVFHVGDGVDQHVGGIAFSEHDSELYIGMVAAFSLRLNDSTVIHDTFCYSQSPQTASDAGILQYTVNTQQRRCFPSASVYWFFPVIVLPSRQTKENGNSPFLIVFLDLSLLALSRKQNYTFSVKHSFDKPCLHLALIGASLILLFLQFPSD